MAKFERDHPLWGRQMQVDWVKIGHFRRKTRYNSKTVQDSRIVSMAMFLMTLGDPKPSNHPNFYRATAMLSAVYAVVMCLCVCLCVRVCVCHTAVLYQNA